MTDGHRDERIAARYVQKADVNHGVKADVHHDAKTAVRHACPGPLGWTALTEREGVQKGMPYAS